MRKAGVVILMTMVLGWAGCRTMDKPVPEPAYYEKYDLYVTELHRAVDRGEMTVAEAEKLRQEAFRSYLQELQEQQEFAEYRNY